MKPQEIQRMKVIEVLGKYDRIVNMENSMGEGSVNGASDDSLSGDDTI